ncbi:MAG TPA: SGNH/GDSL hydrolase family protein [Pirellulales bacterium]|nr:SGNH/GDSL hydrolase family protein [Pirellulales bacterium]
MALSVIVWEIILRALIVVPIPYHHDPALGWMPVPHSTGLYTLEGRGVCAYNERGFRGAAIGPKRPGEIRIAAIGDSYTEGQQMDIEYTFPYRLEEILSAPSTSTSSDDGDRPRVRVFNAGRGATSPLYYIALADTYRQIFEPDWVVIVLHDENWQQLFDRSFEFSCRPTGDGFVIDEHWLWPRKSRLMRMLLSLGVREIACCQYAFNRLSTIAAQRSMTTIESPAEGESPGLTNPPLSSTEINALDWVVARLAECYPRLVIVHTRAPYSPAGTPRPASEYERLLGASCERHGVPFLPMRECLIDDYQRSGKPSFGFANTMPWTGHPNARGHEQVARALANFFATRLKAERAQ